MRRWVRILAATLSAAAILWAVTLNGSLEILGTLRANVVDFSSSTATAPMKTGTALPETCSVGQAFFKTDAAAGQNINLCTAANTWTQVQGGGGGGGAWNMKPDLSYMLMRAEFSPGYNLGSPTYQGDFVFVRSAGSQNLNNPTATTDGRLGAITISTTATSGNRSYWVGIVGSGAADAHGLYARTNKDWEVVYVFRYPAATDYSASTFFAGLSANTSETPPKGVGVRYMAGTDSALMFYTSSANTWGSLVSTGVAPDTSWHKVRIRSDGTAVNKMWISLDGGTEMSVCPSGCDLTWDSWQSGNISSFGISLATNEAAQKLIQLDYLHLWMNWGAR